MKLPSHTQYVPYGPVGHPGAKFFMSHIGRDFDDVFVDFFGWLARYSVQGNAPTMFFATGVPLDEQGYHILPVIDGEVSDDLIASLVPVRIFSPAKEGEAGRSISEFKSRLPGYVDLDDFRVLRQGQAECDHDFGLESWEVLFERSDGKFVSEAESHKEKDGGTFFNAVTCSRCGRKHAYPEREEAVLSL